MKRYHVRVAPFSRIDWGEADVLAEFAFPWEEGVAPRTEFRALFDGERLHFRFDCEDSDLVLGQGATARDRVVASDRVEIFLAPDLGLDPYYCFEMDPRGEVLAYRARFHRRFDWDWRCDEVQVGAVIEGCRYRVEGDFPLSLLRKLNVLRHGGREFFAGVYRAEFSHEEDGSVRAGWMSWVDPRTDRPDFHVPASFGVFELDQ